MGASYRSMSVSSYYVPPLLAAISGNIAGARQREGKTGTYIACDLHKRRTATAGISEVTATFSEGDSSNAKTIVQQSLRISCVKGHRVIKRPLMTSVMKPVAEDILH